MKNNNLSKEILIFTTLNAIVINFAWWFLFCYIRRGVEGIKVEGFHDFLGDFIFNLYQVVVFIIPVLLILVLITIRSNVYVAKTIFCLASWMGIISPFFGLVYWINFSYWMSFLYHHIYLDNGQIIMGFLFALGVSYFHFYKSKAVVKKINL